MEQLHALLPLLLLLVVLLEDAGPVRLVALVQGLEELQRGRQSHLAQRARVEELLLRLARHLLLALLLQSALDIAVVILQLVAIHLGDRGVVQLGTQQLAQLRDDLLTLLLLGLALQLLDGHALAALLLLLQTSTLSLLALRVHATQPLGLGEIAVQLHALVLLLLLLDHGAALDHRLVDGLLHVPRRLHAHVELLLALLDHAASRRHLGHRQRQAAID